jgi:hypothetical protein
MRERLRICIIPQISNFITGTLAFTTGYKYQKGKQNGKQNGNLED